jgi:hypothetical protein
MKNMRKQLISASKQHYQAHIEKHRINIEVMLENPTAMAEHSDIMDAIEKEVDWMAEYEDKLEIMEKYFPIKD